MANIALVNPDPSVGPSGFAFNTSNGVKVSRFDIGHPEVRMVEDARPFMHGSDNYTKFFGPRAISIDFIIAPVWKNASNADRRNALDDLRGLSNPRLRPYLKEWIDGITPRKINVIIESLSLPFEFTNRVMCQVQMRAYDGFWLSEETRVYTIYPGEEDPVVQGRDYNLTFNRTYPLNQAPASGTIIPNNGNIESYPLVNLYGPFTDATIRNSTAQHELILEDCNLLLGEWIEIDFRNRTILRNGDQNDSFYGKVDWLLSEWWELAPGNNTVSFIPTDWTEGSTKAEIFFNDNWI